MGAIVHRYGVQRHWDAPAEMLDQIRLGHELRNRLVEIDRDADERLAAIAAADVSVAAIDDELVVLTEKLAARTGAVKASRVTGRTKTSDPAVRAEERDMRGRVAEAKGRRKAARTLAYAAAKPAIELVRADRKAAVKATYPEFTGRGLHWATWNDTAQKHEVSRQRIFGLRKQGRSADSRFHRWTGEGTIAVQLQRGADQPRSRDAATLAAADSPWRNVLGLPPMPSAESWARMTRAEQRSASRVTLRWSIGQGRIVDVPVVMHRPLPERAEVVSASLTRRMIGGHAKVTVQLVCRVADVEPVAGPLAAVHVGWRKVTGGTRVAVIVSSQPIKCPDTLRDVVRPVAGGWEVVLPDRWRDGRERLHGVASVRSTNLDAIRDAVVGWMWTTGETAESLDLRSHPSSWRAPGRFAWLARHLAETRPEAPIVGVLESWRRQDRHLWEWHAHGTDKLVGRRSDAYGRVGAWLGSVAGGVLLGAWTITDVRAAPDSVDDTYEGEQSRRTAQLAAPAELLAAVRAAAVKRGVAVAEDVPASGVHWGCGGALPAEDRRRSVLVACSGCGEVVDQDVNAARRHLGERSGGVAEARDRSQAM